MKLLLVHKLLSLASFQTSKFELGGQSRPGKNVLPGPDMNFFLNDKDVNMIFSLICSQKHKKGLTGVRTPKTIL